MTPGGKTNTLNFCRDGELPEELLRPFNETAREIRRVFTEALESVSLTLGDNPDWWFSGPASRNTLASPLYQRCCALALLKKLAEKDSLPALILTDSEAFKKTVEAWLAEKGLHSKVENNISFAGRLKRRLKSRFNEFWSPIYFLIIKYHAAATRGRRRHPDPEKQITLVDTFIHRASLAERHFTGMAAELPEEERKNIWFAPVFFQLKNLKEIFRAISGSEGNYLIREDYLTVGDALYALGHGRRVSKLEIPPCPFRGFDIAPLIKEELKEREYFSSAFLAFLSLRFPQRLRGAGVKIRLVLDWFENQSCDKGFNKGFREHYPDTPLKGYQGFIVMPEYLCCFPTTLESRLGFLPKTVAVIGGGLVERTKEFCPELKIEQAPAFRFAGVRKEKKRLPDDGVFTILAALPIMPREGVLILRALSSFLKNTAAGRGVKILVKPHPDHHESGLSGMYGEALLGQFEKVRGDLGECLERAGLLVSLASSSCVQAICSGVPVIILASRNGLTYNPVPPETPPELWRVCYSGEDTALAVRHYMERTPGEKERDRQLAIKTRDSLINPVTAESVRKFLEFT